MYLEPLLGGVLVKHPGLVLLLFLLLEPAHQLPLVHLALPRLADSQLFHLGLDLNTFFFVYERYDLSMMHFLWQVQYLASALFALAALLGSFLFVSAAIPFTLERD